MELHLRLNRFRPQAGLKSETARSAGMHLHMLTHVSMKTEMWSQRISSRPHQWKSSVLFPLILLILYKDLIVNSGFYHFLSLWKEMAFPFPRRSTVHSIAILPFDQKKTKKLGSVISFSKLNLSLKLETSVTHLLLLVCFFCAEIVMVFTSLCTNL